MSYQTYLCYFLGVTHESIYYATMAHESLQDPRRFIHLVQLHIARRELLSHNGVAIDRLPVEIGELIKHELVDLELAEARASLDACIKAHVCPDAPFCTATTWQNAGSGCKELYESDIAISGVAFGDEAKACRRLLRRYNLTMPSHRPLLREWVGECQYRSPATLPDSIVIIALPKHGESNREDAEDQPAYDGPDVTDDFVYNDAICNVSFKVPTDADLRFAALVRDYHLDPVEVDDGEVRVSAVSSSPPKDCLERLYTRVRPEQLRPRWKLFSTAFANW